MAARRAAAVEPGDHPPPVDPGYGYGVFIGAIAGREAYFHPGDVPGYVSLSAWLAEDRISIAILCNDDAGRPEDLIKDLLPIAYG